MDFGICVSKLFVLLCYFLWWRLKVIAILDFSLQSFMINYIYVISHIYMHHPYIGYASIPIVKRMMSKMRMIHPN